MHGRWSYLRIARMVRARAWHACMHAPARTCLHAAPQVLSAAMHACVAVCCCACMRRAAAVQCLHVQVSFFFYKNLLFGLTIYFYNALCFFSGQIIYNGAPCSPLRPSLLRACMQIDLSVLLHARTQTSTCPCTTSSSPRCLQPPKRLCGCAWMQCLRV